MELAYFGLQVCPFLANPSAGLLLPWFEFIAIAAIIFAVSEFAESNKTRSFLFELSILKKLTAWIMLISTLLIVFANLLPLISASTVPIFSYPASYELLVLIFLSILFIVFCLFFMNPYFFRPRFGHKTLQKLARIIVRSNDKTTISNLLVLLLVQDKFRRSYLDQIVENASKDVYDFPKLGKDEDLPEIVYLSRQFIDVLLSKEDVCKIIANDQYHFISEFIRLAEHHNLQGNRTGSIFFDNLVDSLLHEEGSLLARETKRGGYEGVFQPTSSLIYTNDFIMWSYSPLPMFYRGLPAPSLKLVVHCLEIAFKHYFSKESSSYSNFLGRSIKNLGESASSYVYEIPDRDDVDLWRQDTKELSIIAGFFHKIEYMLSESTDSYEKYKPVFSEDEKQLAKYSVTESIAISAFKFLEAFAWIKNNDDYVRHMLLDAFMWLFYDITAKNSVQQGIQNKFLDLIKARIEENLEDRYPSLIRILCNMYGYQNSRKDLSPVHSYYLDIFDQTIANKLIEDAAFRERHMPHRWKVKGKKITDVDGNEVYPNKQRKKRK